MGEIWEKNKCNHNVWGKYRGPGTWKNGFHPTSVINTEQFASPLRTHYLHFLKEAIRFYRLWHSTFLWEMSNLIEADNDYNQAFLSNINLFSWVKLGNQITNPREGKSLKKWPSQKIGSWTLGNHHCLQTSNRTLGRRSNQKRQLRQLVSKSGPRRQQICTRDTHTHTEQDFRQAPFCVAQAWKSNLLFSQNRYFFSPSIIKKEVF